MFIQAIKLHGTKSEWQAILRICMVLALLLSAFAHQPVALAKNAEQASVDLSAYGLPDGSLPVLCIAGAAGSSDGADIDPCPFCVLAATSLLPLPTGILLPVHFDVTGLVFLRFEIGMTSRYAFKVSAPPTGPPFFST